MLTWAAQNLCPRISPGSAVLLFERLFPPAAGRYKFRVLSDDGSKVFLDGKLMLNNDGLHGARAAAHEVDLDTSWHDVRIEYMQGPRYSVALQVFCTAPGGKEQIFPACNMALDSPGRNWWWLWLLLLLLIAIIAEETWRRRHKRQTPQAQ
jgi:PA14 domain